MKEGKHKIEKTKNEKKTKKLKIVFLCIILIGIIAVGGFYLKDNMPIIKNNDKKEVEEEKKENDNVMVKVEELINSKAPTIWYYNDREKVKVQIEDGTLFKDYIKISISRGEIEVFTRDGENFKEEYSPDTELSEGEYFIRVEAEDGTSCEKSFIIDTIPPKVTGIINKRTYTKMPTIKFEDISDIKEATLTKGKSVVDLKEKSAKQEDGTATYEVKENGEYTLSVKDTHGIELKRTFKVEIE